MLLGQFRADLVHHLDATIRLFYSRNGAGDDPTEEDPSI